MPYGEIQFNLLRFIDWFLESIQSIATGLVLCDWVSVPGLKPGSPEKRQMKK